MTSGLEIRSKEWLRNARAFVGRPRPLIWVLILVGAAVLAAVLWLYFLDWNTMRGPVARYASYRLGREVRIEGPLDVHLFSFTPRASVSGLTVANPSWAGKPLAAEVTRLSVSIRLMPLLIGKVVLPNLELEGPKIEIVRERDGRTNWDFGKGGDGWKLPPIHRFVVNDGQLRIDDRRRKMVFVGTISSQERADGGDNSFHLLGQGTLNGNVFVADVHGGPLINVDESKPYRFAADIRSGATHIVGDGAILRPFDLHHFWAAATFSGANLADLYYLTGVAFPGTPPYALAGTLSREGPLYKFSKFSGMVGETDLRGDLSVQSDVNPSFVTAVLASHRLRFRDLGPLFGANPTPSGPQSPSTHLLPDTPLHLERIRETDADVQYDAETVASRDFPLRGLHGHVVLRKGVMVLDPVAFEFAHGRLAGSLKIDARGETPATALDARLTGLHFEQFLVGDPPPLQGLLEARVVAHGVGNSVHQAASTANGAVTLVVPTGKFRKLYAEMTGINLLNGLGLMMTNDKSEIGLRCAVAHFDMHSGVLHAKLLVVDTDSVRIDGTGSVDLSRETLDLSVSGKPKEIRFGRIRAPIAIHGPLSDPSIGLKAGSSLAQGGGAVALGIVLSPLAALLAFVDPGLAKDANCAALDVQASHGSAPVARTVHRHASSRQRHR